MEVSPNGYVFPKNNGNAIFREKSGYLIIPDRIRFNTTHVIAMLSDIPTLSNVFYTLKIRDENETFLKIICLWLNTTWGILLVIADRQETEGAWIRVKMTQWRLVSILDVFNLREETLNNLVNIFEEFRNVDLGRIPEQYDRNSDTYRLRLELDKSFLEAFEIEVNEDDLEELYREIHFSLKQWIG